MIKTIFGAGGFAREIEADVGERMIKFIDDRFFPEQNEEGVFPFSDFEEKKYKLIVAIGDPLKRFNICKNFNLEKDIKFYTFISPRAILLKEGTISIGKGGIVCAGSILTTNIKRGIHSQINLNTTIGHDCVIGNFFTSGPGVNISGNCKIGDRVYIGSNSTVKEGITICEDVIIGMNSGVVKDITEPGTYVGCPCKKIK